MESVAISDDALKLLVAENGVRGTARLLGMDEKQTDAFRQRVTRGKWLSDPAIAAMRAKASPTSPFTPVVAKMSPAQAIATELQQLGTRTRLSLAKGIAKAGEHIEQLQPAAIVEDAQNVKAIAQTADLLHGYRDAPAPVKIRLEVLAAPSENQVIDVESSVIPDVSNSTVTDSELDEY